MRRNKGRRETEGNGCITMMYDNQTRVILCTHHIILNRRDTRSRMRRNPRRMLFHCVAFAERHDYLGAYSESSIESAHHDVHLTFENHGSSGRHIVHKQRRMHSDIIQRRISRIECGHITLPPTPRLCHTCGRSSAKYLNHGQQHHCLAL